MTLTAPAKLTVSLRVVGRRRDGYHLLDAEMVSVDLVDELTLAEAPEPAPGVDEGGTGDEPVGLEIGGPGGAALPYPLSTGPDNLVNRALRVVGRRARARLVKRIPPGGGLGGGSTDAAAVLRWAGCRDLDVAASLGADVPFCVAGGRARVTGIGEQVTPLAHVDRTFTLLTPPCGCSTPDVYRAWDELGSLPGAANDLQGAALAVEPELARWRDELAAASGQAPVLAGSGSTWFVEGAFPGAGRIVVRTVPPHTPNPSS